MGHGRRAGLLATIVACAVIVLAAAGCGQPKPVEMTPKVAPPAIKQAGELRAGIETTNVPFAGTDSGQQAGIDIDVAAALAERLGLKLVIVPMQASDVATALADGTVDVALSVPFSEEALSNVTLAGSYISDAPGFFVATDSTASIEPSMTMQTLPLPPAKVGVQKGSVAYWKLLYDLGPEAIQTYSTLREAFTGLANGEVPVVAGDAVVGAYIARDQPTIHFAGQLQPAVLLGVAVAPENSKLSDAVRTSLDGLAADGVLDTIRTKWVGDLAKLKVASSQAASETTTPASDGASSTAP